MVFSSSYSRFPDDDIYDNTKEKGDPNIKIDITKIIIEIQTPNRVGPSPYLYIYEDTSEEINVGYR